jgi:site-specific recombinase XerC
MKRRLPPGLYQLPTGAFRAVACISRTQRTEKRFPKGTPERTMTRWQETARAELRRLPTATKGSLLADLEDAYLPAVAGMPTVKERERHLRMWAAQLGERRRRETVTGPEIRAALERWRLAGGAAGTCNRARTALMHFYSVLDGKAGRNPVRDVATYREPRHPPRDIDYPTFERLLAAMPDRGQGLRGVPRSEVSQTKARLRVIAYTGLPHAQVKAIEPAHIRWAERALYVPGREKGEGTADRWLPLSRAGVAALATFADAKAWGPFSTSAMHSSFQRAAKAIGRPDLRPYDLRHLFGTQVLASSRNRAATRDLLLHTSDVTTARYTSGAISLELRAAIDAFDRDVVVAGCGEAESRDGHATVTDTP